jgi:hypothetical protein
VFHRLVSEKYPYSTYPIDEEAPVLLVYKPCDEENPAQCGTEGCESVVLAHSNYHVKSSSDVLQNRTVSYKGTLGIRAVEPRLSEPKSDSAEHLNRAD